MRERVEEFLAGLRELSFRTGVYVTGCGRCDGSLTYGDALELGKFRDYSLESLSPGGEFTFGLGAASGPVPCDRCGGPASNFRRSREYPLYRGNHDDPWRYEALCRCVGDPMVSSHQYERLDLPTFLVMSVLEP